MNETHDFDWCVLGQWARLPATCQPAVALPQRDMFRWRKGTRVRRHNKGKDVALAVARGLCFMHSNGVTHRHAIGHGSASHATRMRACAFRLGHLPKQCPCGVTTLRLCGFAKVRGIASIVPWMAITRRSCAGGSASRGRPRSRHVHCSQCLWTGFGSAATLYDSSSDHLWCM